MRLISIFRSASRVHPPGLHAGRRSVRQGTFLRVCWASGHDDTTEFGQCEHLADLIRALSGQDSRSNLMDRAALGFAAFSTTCTVFSSLELGTLSVRRLIRIVCCCDQTHLSFGLSVATVSARVDYPSVGRAGRKGEAYLVHPLARTPGSTSSMDLQRSTDLAALARSGR